MTKVFSGLVNKFAKAAPLRMQAVWRRALELFAEELNRTAANGGTLPHVTGNLHRSLLAQIGSMIEAGPPDAKFEGGDVGAVIADALVTDSVFIGWQAVYARRQNYGFVGEDSLGRQYNQTGRHFVERAVKLWPVCVKRANNEVEKNVDAY